MKRILPAGEVVTLSTSRIEITELLEILERLSSNEKKYKVTGKISYLKSEDIHFDGIKEMRGNLAMFAQNPTIQIGPVELVTEDRFQRPHLSIQPGSLHGNDEAQRLMESLQLELKRYQQWPTNIWVRILLILCSFILCLASYFVLLRSLLGWKKKIFWEPPMIDLLFGPLEWGKKWMGFGLILDFLAIYIFLVCIICLLEWLLRIIHKKTVFRRSPRPHLFANSRSMTILSILAAIATISQMIWTFFNA